MRRALMRELGIEGMGDLTFFGHTVPSGPPAPPQQAGPYWQNCDPSIPSCAEAQRQHQADMTPGIFSVPTVVAQGHELMPWPASWGAFPIKVNGDEVDPAAWADSETFTEQYNALVTLRLSFGFPSGRPSAVQRSQEGALLGQLAQTIASMSVDVGRWIIKHDPIAAFVDGLSRGETLGEAFDAGGYALQKNLQDVGPYIQTAVSFIPGWGQIAAAAIGAAVALAKGEPIDQGLIDALAGSLPGGAVTGAAMRAGGAAIKDAIAGVSLDQAALDIATSAVPPGAARIAFSAGVAIAGAALAQSNPEIAAVLLRQAQKDPTNAAVAGLPPPAHTPTAAEAAAHAKQADTAHTQKAPAPAPVSFTQAAAQGSESAAPHAALTLVAAALWGLSLLR